MLSRRLAVCGLLVFLALALQASAAKRPFRVIAFGDSTTEGWVPKAKKFIPFTITLEAMLQKRLQKVRPVEVVNAGLGFSTVLGGKDRPPIVPFCRKQLAEAKSNGIVYDWVIIWIGQNDLLALDAQAGALMSVLRPWFVEVLNSGSNLLIVSPVNYKSIARTDPKEKQLKRLSDLFQDFTDKGNANLRKRKSKRRIRFLNLRKRGFNPYVRSAAQYARIFDDFHLSKDGYRILGTLAYYQIIRAK